MVCSTELVFHTRREMGAGPWPSLGRSTSATAPGLRRELETLIAEAHSPAVVDLSAVTFIDASGLSELVAAKRKVAHTDVEIVLVDPSAPCRRILEVTGLDRAFEIEIEPNRLEGCMRDDAVDTLPAVGGADGAAGVEPEIRGSGVPHPQLALPPSVRRSPSS